MKPTNRRKNRIIEPRLQIRAAAVILSITVIAGIIQMPVMWYAMSALAESMPNDGALLKSKLPLISFFSGLITMGFLAPFAFSIGLYMSFRVFGPIYRFRVYLQDLRDGRRPGPCHLRENDMLQDFCGLLNDATEGLRLADADDSSLATDDASDASRATDESMQPAGSS